LESQYKARHLITLGISKNSSVNTIPYATL
jgi:hypothetical protein